MIERGVVRVQVIGCNFIASGIELREPGMFIAWNFILVAVNVGERLRARKTEEDGYDLHLNVHF